MDNNNFENQLFQSQFVATLFYWIFIKFVLEFSHAAQVMLQCNFIVPLGVIFKS